MTRINEVLYFVLYDLCKIKKDAEQVCICLFHWYARVESNHRTRLRRPMLYPLSYGRIVFGAQCTIANYSITASFLQVLYWVDEIKNIIKKQEVQ